ncbi:MAG TPA: MFS transporter [Actinomycetes bacterium]|nr:MFS transporter [Actinomycetes bacterium]
MTGTEERRPPSVGRQGVQRRTVRVLGGAQVLSGIGVGAGIAAGSLLVAELTDNDSLAGLAQTFGVIGAAIAAGPLAWLSAKTGRRTGLATGLWIAAVGSVVVVVGAALGWVPMVLVGTLGVGVASAVGLQARYAASDLAAPQHVARDLAFVVWATTIGAVLGPNLMEPASRLADALSLPPLSGAYLVTAVSVTLAAMLVLGWLRPDPLVEARRLASGEGDPGKVPQEPEPHPGMVTELARGWRVVRQSPGASLAVASIAVGHVVMVMVMVMTPVHMQHVDVTLQVVGLVISVHILGMFALSPVVGSLADRWGSTTVIALGVMLLATATAIAGTASGDSIVQLGIGLFLLGLGWSGTLVGGSALLSTSVAEADRPVAQGVGDTVMNVAAAAGGALAGVIVYVASYGWLNVAAAACLVPLAIGLARGWGGRENRRRVADGIRTPVR